MEVNFMDRVAIDAMRVINKKKEDIFNQALSDKGYLPAEVYINQKDPKCRIVISGDWEYIYHTDGTFIVAFKKVDVSFTDTPTSHLMNTKIQYQTTLPIIDKI